MDGKIIKMHAFEKKNMARKNNRSIVVLDWEFYFVRMDRKQKFN